MWLTSCHEYPWIGLLIHGSFPLIWGALSKKQNCWAQEECILHLRKCANLLSKGIAPSSTSTVLASLSTHNAVWFIYLFRSGKSVRNYVENCRTVFHGGCTILHSHPKWVRVHVVRILISNGLMTWDFEHLFMYLFAICISSLVLSVQIFCPVFN